MRGKLSEKRRCYRIDSYFVASRRYRFYVSMKKWSFNAAHMVVCSGLGWVDVTEISSICNLRRPAYLLNLAFQLPPHLSIIISIISRLISVFLHTCTLLPEIAIHMLAALAIMIPHGARRALRRINEQAMNENDQADNSEAEDSNSEVLDTPLMTNLLDRDTNYTNNIV